jgi:ATP-binding cassette, subfamily B (MDR/TAP), member 1
VRLLFAAQPAWIDIALIISGTLFATAAGVPFPLIAVVFGQLVDDMNGATCAAKSNFDGFDYESQINGKIALMAYIAIGAFFIVYAYITIWGVISQRLAQRMRVVYLRALLRQPPSFFDARASAQDISSSLHGDIAAIQAGTSEKVGIFITTISFFITSFTIAFIKQAKLAGMLTSMVPAFLFMSVGGGLLFGRYAGRMADSFASASALAGECLSNISVVQAFGASARLEAKFSLLTSDASKNGIRKATVAAVQAGLLYFIAYAGNALAFWQGSIFIADTADGHGDGTSVGGIYTVIMILVDGTYKMSATIDVSH